MKNNNYKASTVGEILARIICNAYVIGSIILPRFSDVANIYADYI